MVEQLSDKCMANFRMNKNYFFAPRILMEDDQGIDFSNIVCVR